MWRQLGGFVDTLDLFARHIGERIEFQPDAILFDNRHLGTKSALKSLASVDAATAQRPIEFLGHRQTSGRWLRRRPMCNHIHWLALSEWRSIIRWCSAVTRPSPVG